jgi:tellurite methyltransferase
MVSKDFFDSVYKKANRLEDKYIWGSKADKVVVKSIKYIKGKEVLDLGTGEGKNAIYLTRKGFSVLGVDYSLVGLSRMRKRLKELDIKVKIKRISLVEFSYPRKYSAIFAINTLEFIERKELKHTVNSMKANTLEEGINVIKTITVNDPQYKKRKDRIFLKLGELKKYYEDWEIIHYREYVGELEKHTKDNKLHRHAVAEVIARKK